MTAYVAELENQDLRLIKDGDPSVPFDIEVYPIYGRADADRWLEANGYVDDGRDWRKVQDSKPAIWIRVVTK
ncbi:hypothetical protein [Paractinoplanes maris]|uniref:hypothetical protein n=1 Tax=Paractinoplanes maris TaxID=1734446 RepID=UPI0020205265|nr:hypothetical protein [Actinoplanes maris]